jgi:hypothetical protein
VTVKVDKRSRWYDEKFQPNAGPVASDDFAPLGLTGSGALRDFIQRQTFASISDNRSSETLAPGVYIRRQANGTWELLIKHTRGSFRAFYAETRDQILEIAAEKMEERNDAHNNVR